MKIKTFLSYTISLKKNKICSICLEPLYEDYTKKVSNIFVTSCNHAFHKACFQKYILYKTNTAKCPICRNPNICNYFHILFYFIKLEFPVEFFNFFIYINNNLSIRKIYTEEFMQYVNNYEKINYLLLG